MSYVQRRCGSFCLTSILGVNSGIFRPLWKPCRAILDGIELSFWRRLWLFYGQNWIVVYLFQMCLRVQKLSRLKMHSKKRTIMLEDENVNEQIRVYTKFKLYHQIKIPFFGSLNVSDCFCVSPPLPFPPADRRRCPQTMCCFDPAWELPSLCWERWRQNWRWLEQIKKVKFDMHMD